MLRESDKSDNKEVFKEELTEKELAEKKSIENVKKFYDALKTDPKLYKKLDEIDEKFQDTKLTKEKKREIIKEYIIPIATEFGFPFTIEDLDLFEKSQKEISLDDISGVAGGVPIDINKNMYNSTPSNNKYNKNNFLVGARGGEESSNYSNILGWLF